MDKVTDGIYPQTNYTTQQFYTKEEYERLQAEYNDLHLNYAGCKTANTGLQELNEKLQAENEFLKKELEKHKSMIAHNLKPLIDSDFQGKLKELEQENERLKKLKFKSDGIELLQDANLNLHNANVKYRQCLQEIREYCEEQNLKADYTACEILDKINSVIGAE